MPAAHIRVIATPNGGGFGGKSDPFNHEIVVAKAALLLDRPVKICLTREEVFYCHRGRHPVLMRFRTGVTSDGKITGTGSADAARRRRLRLVRRGEHVLHRRAADGDLRHSRATASAAAACSPTSRRAARSAATARRRRRFGQEVQLDKIAEHLAHRSRPSCGCGIVAPPDTLTANYLRVGTIGLAECIRRSSSDRDWRETVPQAAARPRRRARVLVVSLRRRPADLLERHAALRRAAEARSQRRRHRVLRRHRDRPGLGRRAGRRCVAEVLGIDPFDVRAVTGDTDLTPVDLGSYSSRVTLMMGNAAIQAAERARDDPRRRGRAQARGARRIDWCSPTAACSTARTRIAA